MVRASQRALRPKSLARQTMLVERARMRTSLTFALHVNTVAAVLLKDDGVLSITPIEYLRGGGGEG